MIEETRVTLGIATVSLSGTLEEKLRAAAANARAQAHSHIMFMFMSCAACACVHVRVRAGVMLSTYPAGVLPNCRRAMCMAVRASGVMMHSGSGTSPAFADSVKNRDTRFGQQAACAAAWAGQNQRGAMPWS